MSDTSNNLIENPTDVLYRILGLDVSNNQTIPNTLNAIQSETNNVNTDYRSFISSLFRPSGMNNVLRRSFADPSQNAYKQILSEEGEKSIKYEKYETGKFQNDACPMTLNNFIVGEEIAQLPCNHIFEKNAILKWLKDENASCPVCRKLLDSKEVKKKVANVTPVQNPTHSPMNIIMEIMNRRLRQEEEREIQTAIMASLIDQESLNDVD
jgi:hypothetical protein